MSHGLCNSVNWRLQSEKRIVLHRYSAMSRCRDAWPSSRSDSNCWRNTRIGQASNPPLAFLRAKVDDVPEQGPLRHDLIPATVGTYVQLEYIHVDILPPTAVDFLY